MNNNWQKVKLSEIIQLIGGGTPKTTNNTYWNGNIPWLSVVDFNDDNRYVTTTEKTITELGLQNSTTHLLDKGDIIISARGTVGALAQLATPMAFNQSCYGIKATERSCNDFLYYLLKNSIGKLKKNTHGSVFNTITRDTFSNIVVSIPPLDEQRKIAGVLSALDDKIELNNKINRNLEAQAQAIFKSWFIDFEPFKNGKFIDSELGKIPEGWSIGTIGDISIISTGKRPDKKSVNKSNETPIPIIGASSIMGYTNKALYNDKILITGRVGTHGIIQKIDSPCWPSDNTLILRSKNLNFLHNCLLLINWKSMNRGSTQPLITQNDLKNTRIILPQDKIIQNYEQLVHYFDIKFHNNNKEIYALSQICDLLLPKLMSGEVNISDYIA